MAACFAHTHCARMCLQFKTDTDRETFKRFFQEVQQAVDSKQLRPMIRTQYNRTAFQVPFDATVRISLDTNLAMIKENTDGQPVGLLHRSVHPFILITKGKLCDNSPNSDCVSGYQHHHPHHCPCRFAAQPLYMARETEFDS